MRERYKGLEIRAHCYGESEDADLSISFGEPSDRDPMEIECERGLLPKLPERLRAAARHLSRAEKYIRSSREASVVIDDVRYSSLWYEGRFVFMHDYTNVGRPLVTFKDCIYFFLRMYPASDLYEGNMIQIRCAPEQFRRLCPALMKVADFVDESRLAKGRRGSKASRLFGG